ncbi:Calcineurin-like phosphoesterase family protein [Candida parapsilosis]|uniref:Calcineurin-like phosphoesterase family protein n=1 Tax=Candida parapsilosis TaxID=5480 RepID=A0A8X7TC01_CANPA|nr:Calcineurin-like phosphoesterase family protein [Candida parapsilosis]KAF6049533.1 Calcineurin-like phosphoesterase family protein [Candida parapsilosis]KAF6057384.1 Calcineurin-like phosphoesterase family protein [Candida parapsilosis]KAF6065897.1 Calcineurin-like phosphoesterase family protein [Candida parapsilosis]KAI5902896.1 Sphingomyelin phosphodiesterase 2 [Candida parapsilosis]
MVVAFKVFILLGLAVCALAQTIPGHGSLQRQLISKRSRDDITDEIFLNLPATEIDFINYHLKNLTDATGSKCDKCKSRIKYAKSLVDEYPEQEHLVTLLLFKDCTNNAYYPDSCYYEEFFVTTHSQNFEAFNDDYDSGITSGTSVNFFDNDFLHVIKHFNVSSDLDLEYYCYFKGKKACDLPETPDVQELFDIESWWPEKKPEYNNQPQYKNNSERFNVVHVTDFHIQPRYELGSESNCTEYPCCLPESYNKQLPGKDYNFTQYYKNLDPFIDTFDFSFYPDAHYDENDQYIKGDYYDFPKYRGYNWQNAPATSFGAYLADSPELLMNNSLVEIAKLHNEKNFEFVLFTGDLVDHDGVHATPNVTKNSEVTAFNLIKHFLNNITIMPSLGNHDSFPYAQVAPLQFDRNNSYQYNIDDMVNLWVNNEWFDEKDANDLKHHYTGFSYVTNRGLKIIALNSNTYYADNLWAYIDQTTSPDLFGNWKFLIDELVESEQKGQRVWIMAHIPPNNYDVLPIQSRIFGRIIERFSPYTVANLFYGHTHRDQFSILYTSNVTAADAVAEDVINMAWVAQSVTPYTNFNPSWKWYEVEHESFNVINAYNYYTQLNLTFTNGGEEPQWEVEYSARDYYDPEHTWPEDAPLNGTFWHTYVATPLWNTSDVAFNQKFMDLKYRLSPLTPNCSTPKEGRLSSVCFNDNNCFINFYSDNNIKCQS